MSSTLNALSFLEAEGEMGTIMRSYDWASSPLGLPAGWSDSFKSKLNTIMFSSFPMMLFWGSDLLCFYNNAFRTILGKEGKHPAMGKKGGDVWPELWDFMHPLIQRVMSSGKSAWYEDQLMPFYRNGRLEEVYWTFSLSALTDTDGTIAGAVMVCLETTEKVNLFKQLQESNNLYVFAIEASELATWDLNPVTNKFIGNARLKEWFGLAPDEEIDLTLAIEVIAEKDRERVTQAIAHALKYESGGLYDIEYAITDPITKQERILRAKGKATFDEQKQPYRFNGTLQDITPEVLAREQNQKLSILVENSVDLMAILKMDGRNSYINSAGKQILGIEQDADVSQIPITDFHTPEQFAFVAAEIIPSVISTGKWAGQFGIKNCKTGEIIPLYNNCHRIDDERTGTPIGIGTVMRDMRAELSAKQRLEDEVSERTKELLRLNAELERKNKDLASFAFVSSHDLQEPLRKINTFISRIEEDEASNLSERGTLYFNKIKNSASRMQTLINDLLTFSRTNTHEKHFEPCDLNLIIREIEKDFQERLEGAGARLVYDSLPTLNVIPFQARQLFSNIISNSVKFARKAVPLSISISSKPSEGGLQSTSTGSFHCISISDNGIGFEPQYSEKIFEVFQRLHSRDAYEGTGIGLSICKRIMENHNGYITAESSPDAGATFNLYFPAQ